MNDPNSTRAGMNVGDLSSAEGAGRPLVQRWIFVWLAAALCVTAWLPANRPIAAATTTTPTAAQSPTAAPAMVNAVITASYFVHADHTKHGVDVAACVQCHAIDERGTVAVPAALGHSPCLNAGCHATDFVATGAKTQKTDPARYQKAVSFCLGCHASAKGQPPQAWTKAKPDAAFSGPGEYHVEMNHLAHTALQACRDCHAVDGISFKLLDNAPGHRQCIACHNGKPVPAMTQCAMCHVAPSEKLYFTAKRPDSDVRSCGTPGAAASATCFKHDRREHRFRADNSDLQCGSCHFMVADTGVWNGNSYKSIKDIKRSPIIENQKDRAHKACGSSGCHVADVNDGAGRARCGLCHSKKVLDSIFQ